MHAKRIGVEELLDISELDDESLVELAKTGDREAFGELARRHRAKIHGYARKLTKESFLAEDIVQDALVRAFLHLGSLVDAGRFLPWLHRIVRNQAYTKLRKKPFVIERTFSSLQDANNLDEPAEENWRDLDYIVYRISCSAAEAPGSDGNPEERLMRKELLETICGMLRCLNQRERKIFESHFFDHLSPQEIAKLFHLSSANVYQILSRSRKKVMQEKIRVDVDHYLNNRRDLGQMKRVLLPKSGAFAEPGTWTSAAGAMYCLLSYTDKKYSLPAVMGYTGLAFRICIGPGDVHIGGPTSFNFKDILTRGLRNLGFLSSCVEGLRTEPGPNSNLVDPFLLTAEAKDKRQNHKALPDALDLIHRSLDRKLPVLCWDVFIPEFGVIYGYDDENRKLSTYECGKDDTIPYEHLGRGILEDLFILAVEEPVEIDRRAKLSGALQMILEHYHGREEEAPSTDKGLEAYNTWIEAFRGGNIEPNGNAYNVAVVQDARHFASRFLSELAETWQGETDGDILIRKLCGEAYELYSNMADELHELRVMFPFPAGGEPNSPAQAERSIQILHSVKALEERAVRILESIHKEVLKEQQT